MHFDNSETVFVKDNNDQKKMHADNLLVLALVAEDVTLKSVNENLKRKRKSCLKKPKTAFVLNQQQQKHKKKKTVRFNLKKKVLIYSV